MIGKLLGLATVGSTLASMGLLNRFLSGIVSLVILAIVSAFMICGLLAGGFYLVYVCLVHYGLDPEAAGITVGVIGLFLTMTFIALTIDQLRRIRNLMPSRSNLQSYTSLPDMVQLADAFLDGFLGR